MLLVKTSVALYSVCSDVDGLTMVRELSVRGNRAIVDMLDSASGRLTADVELVASVLQGAMAGVSRRLLESKDPEKQFQAVRAELIFLARSYVRARVAGDS